MSEQIIIGRKEREILKFLYSGDAWIQDLYNNFCSANSYMPYFNFVLKRLARKGLISFYYEKNQETKRKRKYVTLTQIGRQVLSQSKQ